MVNKEACAYFFKRPLLMAVVMDRREEVVCIERAISYHRGDIFLADLPPGAGSVQSGVRPVLIVQNDIGNYYAPTLVIAPITAQIKKPYMPTHYILKNIPGLKKTSMVLFEQILTIDKSQIIRYIGKISAHQRQKMDAAIYYSIGEGGNMLEGKS